MIEKMAEMVGVSPQVFIITIVIFVVLFIILYIKISMDEKKGVNSEEKAEIRKIISNLVPDGSQYTAAYAHSKEVYGGARMRREVYHYYAVSGRSAQSLMGGSDRSGARKDCLHRTDQGQFRKSQLCRWQCLSATIKFPRREEKRLSDYGERQQYQVRQGMSSEYPAKRRGGGF